METINELLNFLGILGSALVIGTFLFFILNWFSIWFKRKLTLFLMGIALILCKHKALRSIGWQVLGVCFWEVEDDE